MFHRAIVQELIVAIEKGPPLLQILIGPRQVGKTTAVQQVLASLKWPYVMASADEAMPLGPEWIEMQWRQAKQKEKETKKRVLLVLDEIQKVRGWSEVIKRLWDQEKQTHGKIRPVLLGSSALQEGLHESLAGRFFLHRCLHWSLEECTKAFGWDFEKWIYFGGYPGVAPLVKNEIMWKRYIADSLIETVLSRDVLQLQTVTKPVLLRHLFGLSTLFPAQILSYNKMLGQLTDAGNTTTLAGYLKLLESAFLVSGLERFSQGHLRKRGSSPKLVLWNNALINALSSRSYKQVLADPVWKGRLVENAVGAHFLNGFLGPHQTLTYWRDGNDEVDFVLTSGAETWAIEVKSGVPGKLSGLAAFRKRYPKSKAFLIGSHGIPLEEFFSKPALSWFLPCNSVSQAQKKGITASSSGDILMKTDKVTKGKKEQDQMLLQGLL